MPRVRSLLVSAALAAATLVTAAPAHAGQGDVPLLFTQTGRLFDSNDQPVTGNLTMVFALYDVPTGGTALWTESHDVTFDSGYFIVHLGQTTALPLFDGSPKFLGIQVGVVSGGGGSGFRDGGGGAPSALATPCL